MNRPQVLALFASVSGLVLMCEPAAAQHPYFIARGQVEAAALGTYLSPTAAYPIGPMYYPTAMPAYAGSNLYWRLASAEHVVPGVPAPVEPQAAVAQAQVTQAQVTKAQVTKAQVAQAPAAQAPAAQAPAAQAPAAQPTYGQYYYYDGGQYYYYDSTACQCDRCRCARGECPRRNGGLIDDLWELERRKNAFLKRMIFGN